MYAGYPPLPVPLEVTALFFTQVASCNGRAGLASVLHEMMDGYSSKFGLEHGFWGPEVVPGQWLQGWATGGLRGADMGIGGRTRDATLHTLIQAYIPVSLALLPTNAAERE